MLDTNALASSIFVYSIKPPLDALKQGDGTAAVVEIL